MSVSGINSSAASSIYASIASEEVSTNLTNAAVEMESRLESEGVDEETRDAIQEELATAIEQILTESGGEEMPSPEEMKTTIDGILSEYGLDAEEIMGQGGRGPAPPPPDSSSESSETDPMQTLLDLLAASGEESEDTDLADLAGELSQITMDCLFGIDTEA